MQVCLFVAGPLATVSGAYHYNHRMVESLRAAGHAVQVAELPGRFPDPDQAAIYAARTAWSALPEDAVPLIDVLALPAFDGLPLNRVTALIHHPASLETGLAEDMQTRLHATETSMFNAIPRLVVTSDATATQVVREFKLPGDRVRVIAPGADALPRCPGSAGATCEILSVGALIPRKGHDMLLRALSRLPDLDWHLTIAGASDRDPVHAAGLRALAEDLAIDRRIGFAEHVSENLWQGADIFALTSYYEGYGVAIAEALRRGLPVAVTNVGAVPSLVGPEAGIVVFPGDADQYSKALRRLIFDRDMRLDMAQIAYDSGRTLPSWQEQAKLLAAVLAPSQ